MKIKIDDEFKKICNQIMDMGLSVDEWDNIESDDMFQTEHFSGGYDATEKEFCFSFYNLDKKEYWLQVSFDNIKKILEEKTTFLDIRNPC